ncbi:MAG: sodium:alanine symporter family protein [Oscillospiraceae bacterium]|nr:sodium:alanine symporter family protein [Oscillospiraceae bacterium]
MEKFLELVTLVNGKLNAFAWGPIMLALLIGTGVYLTIRTRCLQVTKFGYIMKNTIGSLFSKKNKGDGRNLTAFQAVSTAMAGTVGTGNIAGVTGALFVGGPGAVFWMWVSAFFGMCTKYCEIALSMKFRNKKDGVYHGGPMYAIEKGLGKNWKWLAVIFAILGGLTSFGIGNIAQSSEIAGAISSLSGGKVSLLAAGIILAVVVAFVVLGGVKRVGQVTSYMVPFMSIFYILAGIAVIVLRITDVPAAFATIFKGAFSFEAVGGGVMGYAIMVAMRQGFARGVFSNEAGMGSAPIAHAASETEEPAEQAMWGVFEVFFDTIIICSITALTVILSGMELTSAALDGFASKGAAAVAAFNSILPGTLGGTIIQISLIFFALSTILSWSYYGERCWGYLTNNNKVFDYVYKIIFVLVCVVGATGSGTLMWDIADTLNGLMALPNLVSLLLLSGIITKITKDYFFSGNKLAK